MIYSSSDRAAIRAIVRRAVRQINQGKTWREQMTAENPDYRQLVAWYKAVAETRAALFRAAAQFPILDVSQTDRDYNRVRQLDKDIEKLFRITKFDGELGQLVNRIRTELIELGIGIG